jgi:hypothetical protein
MHLLSFNGFCSILSLLLPCRVLQRWISFSATKQITQPLFGGRTHLQGIENVVSDAATDQCPKTPKIGTFCIQTLWRTWSAPTVRMWIGSCRGSSRFLDWHARRVRPMPWMSHRRAFHHRHVCLSLGVLDEEEEHLASLHHLSLGFYAVALRKVPPHLVVSCNLDIGTFMESCVHNRGGSWVPTSGRSLAPAGAVMRQLLVADMPASWGAGTKRRASFSMGPQPSFQLQLHYAHDLQAHCAQCISRFQSKFCFNSLPAVPAWNICIMKWKCCLSW